MNRKNKTRKIAPQPNDTLTFNRSGKWLIVLVLSVTFFAFANSLFNGFAYDDTTQITNNPFIRSLSNIPTALVTEAWFWRAQMDKDPSQQNKPSTPYYRPTIMVYFMFGWALFQDTAFGWHLANVLMHLAVVYFVFLILKKVTQDERLSATSALLFAIHPLRSESVAWISGLTDVFLALFLLPAFYLYLLYRESNRPKYLMIGIGLFLVAAFTKEPAVCLPIFIAAYEIFIANQEKPFRERLKPAIIYGAIFLGASVFYFIMRQYALGFLLSDNKYVANSLIYTVLTIPIVIWKYLGLLFWPVDLSLFHATPLVTSPLELRFILPFLGLLGVVAALWPLRNSRIARFAILWFAINLLPVLNLSAFDPNFMVQERYLYIPSIGFSLLIAMGLLKMPIERWFTFKSRRTAQLAIITLLTILFTGRTLAQNSVWKDDMTLWIHGAEVASDQTMPNFILGHEYVKKQQPQKAIEIFEHYMELQPANVVVITNLANAHLQMYEFNHLRSHLTRGIELCEQGLKLNEKSAPLWDTLGHAYTYDSDLKNYAKARAYFSRALQFEPDLTISNFHMGATYVKESLFDEGIRYLELARQQEPDFPDTRKFLGYAYSGRGETQKALDELNAYLQKQPYAIDAPTIRQNIEKLRASLDSAKNAK
jgi:tetratricopeptide (TPR) repeat protein